MLCKHDVLGEGSTILFDFPTFVRSVLKVEDDEALDKVDPEVRKPSGRVYGPRSEDVRLKISRTLKVQSTDTLLLCHV
jgi:hypothetical protein